MSNFLTKQKKQIDFYFMMKKEILATKIIIFSQRLFRITIN